MEETQREQRPKRSPLERRVRRVFRGPAAAAVAEVLRVADKSAPRKVYPFYTSEMEAALAGVPRDKRRELRMALEQSGVLHWHHGLTVVRRPAYRLDYVRLEVLFGPEWHVHAPKLPVYRNNPEAGRDSAIEALNAAPGRRRGADRVLEWFGGKL